MKRGAVDQLNPISKRTKTDIDLLLAVMTGGMIPQIKTLIANGADINQVDSNGTGLIIHAIDQDNADFVKILLDAQININTFHKGCTPLAYAINAVPENIEIIKLLANADKESLNKVCHNDLLVTPLAYAVSKPSKLAVIEVLIDAGANMEALCQGMTLLHYSIAYYYSQIAEMLINKGAKTEALYKDMTCLHHAVLTYQTSIVKILLENGANKEALYNGNTPLTHAFYSCNPNMEVLIDAGALLPAKILRKFLLVPRNQKYIQNLLPHYLSQYSSIELYSVLYGVISAGNLEILNLLLSYPCVEAIACHKNNALLYKAKMGALSNPENFQPLVDKLMQVESIQAKEQEIALRVKSLYHDEITLSRIYYGPLEKNTYTQELEWVAKYALRQPTHCHFFEKDNRLNIHFEDTTINLSSLIKKANLSHIVLDKEDSDLLMSFDDITLSDKISDIFPENYTLPHTFLTDSERLSIFEYTGNFAYKSINSILHGNSPEGETSNPHFYRNTFFKTLFLASGLNKITPSWTRDPLAPEPSIKTYRGEKYLTLEELNQRILKLATEPQGIIQKQPGFSSTSKRLSIAKKFNGDLSLIEYHDQYGKNISPLSQQKKESEYLQLPGYIALSSTRKNKELNIFEANVMVPLFKAQRSVHQEHRFYHLIQKENSKPVFLEGLLEESQFAYDHYLSKNFTENWYQVDWELDTIHGLIPRPNHGLAHSMRVAQLVLVVSQFLMHYDKSRFNFASRDIHIIQLTAIFSVVGRKNDAGFKDMTPEHRGAYKGYKQASSEAFRNYVTEYKFLNMTEDEISSYSKNILNMGEPGENSPSAISLALAHKLDLLRCFMSVNDSLNTHIIEPLNQYMDTLATRALLEYAENLLHATGNRVMIGNMTGYNESIFYTVSTNVMACFNAIDSVPMPEPSISYKKRKIHLHL